MRDLVWTTKLSEWGMGRAGVGELKPPSGDAPACADCLSDEWTGKKTFCECIPYDRERQI